MPATVTVESTDVLRVGDQHDGQDGLLSVIRFLETYVPATVDSLVYLASITLETPLQAGHDPATCA